MRAVQYARFGGPEVLEVVSTDPPERAAGRLAVSVVASSVNRIDLLARAGRARTMTGRRLPQRVGLDFAGTVSHGTGAAPKLASGTVVWGFLGTKGIGSHGTAADEIVVDPAVVSAAPTSVPLEQAAALPLVGLTAVQALRDRLAVQAGQRVLVIGGAGGVGSVAISVATALGATVDAVVGSDEGAKLAVELGAQITFDRHRQSPNEVATADGYDAILDTAGVDLLAYRRRLAPGGRLVTIVPAALRQVIWARATLRGRISFLSVRPDADALAWLAGLVDSGAVRPVIDSVHPLERIADAHRRLESGQATGKIVVTTTKEPQ